MSHVHSLGIMLPLKRRRGPGQGILFCWIAMFFALPKCLLSWGHLSFPSHAQSRMNRNSNRSRQRTGKEEDPEVGSCFIGTSLVLSVDVSCSPWLPSNVKESLGESNRTRQEEKTTTIKEWMKLFHTWYSTIFHHTCRRRQDWVKGSYIKFRVVSCVAWLLLSSQENNRAVEIERKEIQVGDGNERNVFLNKRRQ